MLFLIFVSTSSLSGVGATSAGEGAQNPELHFLPLRALVYSPRFIQTYSNIFKLSIPKSTYFGSRQEKLEKAASLALKRSEAATLWMTNPCTLYAIDCNSTSIAKCLHQWPSMALAYRFSLGSLQFFTPVPV